MTLLAGSPEIDSSPPALTDISRRAPDREWGPRQPGVDTAWCILPALWRIAGPQLHGIPGK
jgi:hypothetical protein